MKRVKRVSVTKKCLTTEIVPLNYLSDPKAFIEYWNDTDDIYKNIEEYNPEKKPKILILLDDIFAGMLRNKTRNPIVIGLFNTGRKLYISLVFITQPYFEVPKIHT